MERDKRRNHTRRPDEERGGLIARRAMLSRETNSVVLLLLLSPSLLFACSGLDRSRLRRRPTDSTTPTAATQNGGEFVRLFRRKLETKTNDHDDVCRPLRSRLGVAYHKSVTIGLIFQGGKSLGKSRERAHGNFSGH